MSIVCVAIIGKSNDPLYLRTWLEHVNVAAPVPGAIAADPSLKFHYHCHTALDVIEERVNPNRRGANVTANTTANTGDLYLGQLFTVDQFKVYAYITNTKIKFVALMIDTESDVSLRSWFRDLHGLYVSTVSNCFLPYDKGLVGHPTFDFNIQKHVKNFMAQQHRQQQ